MHRNKFGNCVDGRVAKMDILEVLMASLASDNFFNIITQIQIFFHLVKLWTCVIPMPLSFFNVFHGAFDMLLNIPIARGE